MGTSDERKIKQAISLMVRGGYTSARAREIAMNDHRTMQARLIEIAREGAK